MSKKMTIEEAQLKLKEKFPLEQLQLLEWDGMTKPCKMKCSNGHITDFFRGENLFKPRKNRGCEQCECHTTKFKTREKIYKELDQILETKAIELKNKPETIDKQNAIFYCHVCKKEFLRPVNDFIKNPTCPNCNKRENVEKNKNNFLDFLFNKYGNEYIVLSEYENCKNKILIKHECGFCYYTNADSLLRNKGKCPKCFSMSKGEKKIYNWLEKNNINFIYQKQLDNEFSNYHFDFYLPDLNVAIEYQGEQHFRKGGWSQEKFEQQLICDENKRQYCKNKNIKLLEINYKEFNNIEIKLNDQLK